MAKFKRYENGTPKKRERRREDHDPFESYSRRKFKQEKRQPKNMRFYSEDEEDVYSQRN